MSRNPRWNPAFRHTVAGEPGNEEWAASRLKWVPAGPSGHVYLSCCVCGVRTTEIFADHNGEPFKAYYCTPCANEVES